MPVKRGRADQIINRLASRLMGSTSHISLMTGFQVVTDMPIQMQPGYLSLKIAGLFNEQDWRKSERRYFSYFRDRIVSGVALPPADPDGFWTGRALQPYLGAVRELLEQELVVLAARYSSAQWLWYLRHIPEFIWHGRLLTTGPYDAMLAEIISASSTAHSEFHTDGGVLQYPLGQSDVEHIFQFCTGVRYLSHIHSYIRWSGKSFRFSHDTTLMVRPEPTRDESEAVELYDQRVASAGEWFISRIGSVVPEQRPTSCKAGIFTTLRLPKSEQRVTYIGALLQCPQKTSVLAKFACDLACLDGLSAFNEIPTRHGVSWWPDEAGSLVILLRLCISFINHNDFDLLRSTTYGFLLTNEENFVAIPKHSWEDAINIARTVFPGISLPADGPDLLAALEKMGTCYWPPQAGAPIRREGDHLFIDVAAATKQLHQILEFQSVGGGFGANLRAGHFEMAVQAIIDASPWAPPPELRTSVGRTVRFRGQAKTDLDAIGFKDGILLLVQCKSRVYSGAYDAGDHQAIRQGIQLIQAAVSDCSSFREFVKKHPQFDNFEFSQFFEIIYVVCTPHIIYIPLGAETSLVAPGLRAAVSVIELRDWLYRR